MVHNLSIKFCGANNICKNSGGGYICACARTFDDERKIGIAICVKKNGVVFAGKICKIVIFVNALQTDRRFAVIERRNVFQNQIF